MRRRKAACPLAAGGTPYTLCPGQAERRRRACAGRSSSSPRRRGSPEHATAREQLLGLRIREAPAQHDAIGSVKPIVGEGGTQDAKPPAEICKIVHRILARTAEKSDFRPKRTCRPRGGHKAAKQDGERQ